MSLTYGAIFLGLCLAGHIVIRMTLPNADPYMFPLVALLASFGMVMIYRIERHRRPPAGAVVRARAGPVRGDDHRLPRLPQARALPLLIVVVSLVLLVLPRLPGIGEQVNGAYLEITVPGAVRASSRTEFAKIGLVIFLASYLRDTRQVMVLGARRVLGVTIPPLKHFGPVLVIWGVAMVALVLLSDIGSSLMFYGALLSMLYVATGRLSFVVIGLLAFAIGAWYLGTHIPHVHARFEDWLHPFNSRLYHATGGSFQVANAMFAQAGWRPVRAGLGPVDAPRHSDPVPADRHDLRGDHRRARAVRRRGDPLAYLLFIYRGFKMAVLARDSFSTLLAVGLATVFALQVFVIVGGVTRVIPLTGVTLPFISYGGRLDRRQLRAAGPAAARLRPHRAGRRRERADHASCSR